MQLAERSHVIRRRQRFCVAIPLRRKWGHFIEAAPYRACASRTAPTDESCHFHNSFPIFHGLMIPSLFMRNLSVERFIPNRSAAPLRPAITHFVFFNVSRIRSRSVSAIVLKSDFVEVDVIRFGRS